MLPEVFRAGGNVGADLAAVDWTATPLGDPDGWPQSLRTVVRIVLASRFSMWMAWGPELTFFCNDAYRRDTLGTKYPWALGKPAREVWAEIWPDIGPRIETVISTGEATWDEALLLFLERSGYREETYHTFSYSPLTDDDGTITGMLCVVSEDTERVVGERRMATLRDLGSDPTVVRTEGEVFATAARHLGRNRRSLPFTLLYAYDEAGVARLVASTGIGRGHAAAPALIAPDDEAAPWPAGELLRGGTVLVPALSERFRDLPAGDWDEPPSQALVVPLPQQGQVAPYGFLVAGLNRYRPLDDGYRGFVELVAGQIAAGVASARAYEQERYRAERLAELDRAKTTFFTNISHEFRTPLTLLLGPAEDALVDPAAPLPPRQRARVEIVRRNASRLLRLVNTLLDFSRLGDGRATAAYEPVDLSTYTAELAASFASATERVGLALTVDCPPLPEPVWVDREMWAKVVLNLLSNALKFTFEGGITVAVDAVDGCAVLRVADTGIGIDGADQTHLFERFHRVAGARGRTHEGSGIGLALVAELAELHGGGVAVESAAGTGSTFEVRVPFGTAHLPAELLVDGRPIEPEVVERHAEGFLAEATRWRGGAGPDALDAVPSPPAAGDRPRVLVVDDNEDMRAYVVSLMAGDYDVRTAVDGVDALDAARRDPPDLVLTDVMMPRLDGFELLAALRADPATAEVPVVLLSARAGEEATVEGLDAGADDYLVKPFSARELLARVRANLELDRVRRTRTMLEHNRALLDQAQRLARVGSWELDLATGAVNASGEFLRQLWLSADRLAELGLDRALDERVAPADRDRLRAAVAATADDGAPLDLEVRVVTPEGGSRVHRFIAELQRDDDGRPALVRGSSQDVTDQRAAEQAIATAAAAREAAFREHRIADELQASLLPPPSFSPDHLEVATYYRPGVQGAHVGGDWYDVIELGAGRTALVIGDVMGRGVRAAAVMGQLRSAVRAYARLDLPPADILEFLDGVVRDLGDDQIVTCVYGVYDPGERQLTYANAGHLPPLLRVPGEPTRALTGSGGPPLGTGLPASEAERVELVPGAILALYTDGLVESRDTDLDEGIESLAARLDRLARLTDDAPTSLVEDLLPDGPDDDVAILLAQVDERAQQAGSSVTRIRSEDRAVQGAREFVAATLGGWQVADSVVDDVVLLASELTTNAIVHGRDPVELRLRNTPRHVVLEVSDGATYLPRRMRPTPDDEHGRGLQLVALLAERWGVRPTEHGKSVWCLVPISPAEQIPAGWTPDQAAARFSRAQGATG